MNDLISSSSARFPTIGSKETVSALLKIDETAYDFLHNLTPSAPFAIPTSNNKSDHVKFGEMIELLAQSTEIAEFVLSSAIEFANQFAKENSMIFHISSGQIVN